MEVVFSKYIPFKGYVAMALFNFIIFRLEYKDRVLSDENRYKVIINHETIHLELMKDFFPWVPIGGILFYIAYLLEWLFRLLFTKDAFSHNAYRNISFEKEAYENEEKMEYIYFRDHFALWR